MIRARSIIRFIARGAIALPLFASGHGTDLLDARFEFDDQQRVLLRITADYSGNPMIATEQEARDALKDALRIEVDGKEHKLSDLAPLSLKPSDQPDPESPIPRGPVDPSLKHQLMVATWQWTPTSGKLRFVVPDDSNQTSLFWLHDKDVKEPRWMMLMANDRTPEIPVPQPPAFWLRLLPAVYVCAGMMLAMACYRWWRQRYA